MQKKKYLYDYPEQRELSKQLQKGDQIIIAEKTGYSQVMTYQMCQGRRKMPERVKKLIELIITVNNERNKIIKEMKLEEENAE